MMEEYKSDLSVRAFQSQETSTEPHYLSPMASLDSDFHRQASDTLNEIRS